jgi:hypothetical protein
MFGGFGFDSSIMFNALAALVSQYGPIEINSKTLGLQQDILFFKAVSTFAVRPFQTTKETSVVCLSVVSTKLIKLIKIAKDIKVLDYLAYSS